MTTSTYPYSKPSIDMRVKQTMIDFLQNHFRYNTLKSWNESTSYANCISLDAMDIPQEFQDPAVYNLLQGILKGDIVCHDWDNTIIQSRENFLKQTEYYIGFNGEQSEYLVLYNTKTDLATKERVMIPGMSIDQDAEFDKWEMNKLRDRVKIIQIFDKTCDDLRNALLDIVRNGTLMSRPLKKKQYQKLFLAGTKESIQKDDPSLAFVYDPRPALSKKSGTP